VSNEKTLEEEVRATAQKFAKDYVGSHPGMPFMIDGWMTGDVEKAFVAGFEKAKEIMSDVWEHGYQAGKIAGVMSNLTETDDEQ
jgi:hypothetical protein